MAPTWRDDRPEAITAASHSAERPSRSMVTIFSALSSSSETRMRLSRSLCGAGFFATAAAGFFAAGFFAAGFLGADFLGAGFLAGAFLAGVFLTGFFTAFLTDFLAGAFLAGAFFAVFFAGFLAAFRAKSFAVRA
jgi:hypothetical protein